VNPRWRRHSFSLAMIFAAYVTQATLAGLTRLVARLALSLFVDLFVNGSLTALLCNSVKLDDCLIAIFSCQSPGWRYRFSVHHALQISRRDTASKMRPCQHQSMHFVPQYAFEETIYSLLALAIAH
jgi:hypothetical protein